jgi:hypothetical protein
MLNASLRGNSADPTAHARITVDEQLPVRLLHSVQRLQLILPVISVAVLALRRQNAELDEDIALVLSRHASDPLNVEVDQLEAMVESIRASHREGESQ